MLLQVRNSKRNEKPRNIKSVEGFFTVLLFLFLVLFTILTITKTYIIRNGFGTAYRSSTHIRNASYQCDEFLNFHNLHALQGTVITLIPSV